MTKICKICKLEKDESEFYARYAKCKVCFNESRKEYYKQWCEANKDKVNEYHKQYYQENKDKKKEYHKQWYEANKDKFKEYKKQWREANKDKVKQWREANKDKVKEYDKQYYQENKDEKKKYVKQYYKANKEKIKEYMKQYNKQYKRNRMKSDPVFKLRQNISSNISVSIKKYGYTKKSKTQELLGISYKDLLIYFENSWLAMYNQPLPDTFDIHHIIPCHTAKDEAELIELQHYRNLIPLTHEDHIKIHSNA